MCTLGKKFLSFLYKFESLANCIFACLFLKLNKFRKKKNFLLNEKLILNKYPINKKIKTKNGYVTIYTINLI